ncbi:AraC family transcriptional regulator [Rathayibacter toxicus]|nr:AraC family transcriptional regulator [Rathayibacter toxicus]QWL33225.1 AraC family transcriptional regulator [Rathayibacter toxicus]QWL35320.1 AraC family transcriptional regulator [Rathayibacter toxicus]QWL37451.1 AraC family transcriptional regulator [Rathayibacter toxicus]QWL39544.1 AraC family transcriptional regulator [Rathayibacter toxicus]
MTGCRAVGGARDVNPAAVHLTHGDASLSTSQLDDRTLAMMDGHNSEVRRSEIGGQDIDEARDFFEGTYNGHRFVVEPSADFSYRYTTIGDEDVTLRRSQFAGSVSGRIQTEGEYVVSWLSAGEGVADLDGNPVRVGHGQPKMFINGRPNLFELHGYRQNLIHFNGSYLESIAAELEGAPQRRLVFETTAHPHGEALRRWSATVAAVARVIYEPSSSPLLRREANRALAVALLETFPHTAVEVPASPTVPRSGRLRQAIEFMYASAHQPLRSEAIAEAAGVSLRTLQSGFRREFGLTPVGYLRQIRLDAVRRDLQAAEPGIATVSEVARRWGFAHLGRFSAAYAQRFGEHPSTTLES